MLNIQDGKVNVIMPEKKMFIKKIIHFFAKSKNDFIKILKIEVSEDKVYKTNKQLGYLYAEILPKCVMAYNYLGWLITTDAQAKDLLKDHTKYYTEIINKDTGEVLKHLKSFAKASKLEMKNIIKYAIIEVCGNADVYVKSPEEYYGE